MFIEIIGARNELCSLDAKLSLRGAKSLPFVSEILKGLKAFDSKVVFFHFEENVSLALHESIESQFVYFLIFKLKDDFLKFSVNLVERVESVLFGIKR
jgi:hypothetical protein